MDRGRNSSLNETIFPSAQEDLNLKLGIAAIPLCVVGVFGSLWCLYCVSIHFKEQHSGTNALMGSLAVSGLTFCGIVLSIHCYTILAGPIHVFNNRPSNYTQHICQAVGYFYWVSQTSSAYSHAAIAINRLFVIVFLRHYLASTNLRTFTALLIALSWIIPAVTFIFPLFNLGGHYGYSVISHKCIFVGNVVKQYVVSYKVINSFVPLGIMLASYSAISVKLFRSRHRLIRVVGVDAVSNRATIEKIAARKQRRWQSEMRTTRIALITCVVFVVCYLPNSIFGFTARTREELQGPIGLSLGWLVSMGCATSPILYVGLSSDMRAIVSSWIRGKLIQLHRLGADRIHSANDPLTQH